MTSTDSLFPQIAASGSNVYVVWQEQSATNIEIFFRASNNSGQTFGPIINISNDTADSQLPQIATVGNNVYIVWDRISGPSDILFASSNNNGLTFSTPVNLSNSPSSLSLSPQITADGSNVYVTWQERLGNDEIFSVSTIMV